MARVGDTWGRAEMLGFTEILPGPDVCLCVLLCLQQLRLRVRNCPPGRGSQVPVDLPAMFMVTYFYRQNKRCYSFFISQKMLFKTWKSVVVANHGIIISVSKLLELQMKM